MKKRLAIMMLLLLTLLVGCSSGSAWKDGTYTGTAEGVHGEIKLSVEVSSGEISKIDVVSHSETSGVSELAFEQMPKLIIEAQSLEVDTVAGATVSSEAILEAVGEALENAN